MNYIIATEGRAGSTLMCQHLKQMGIGKPYPHLSSEILKKEITSIADIAEYLETKRHDGILGTKVSWGILTKLDTDFKLNLNLNEMITHCLPNAKWIHLTRRDRVHQALSRVKHLRMDTSHVKNKKRYDQYKTKETERLLDMPVPVQEIHDRLQRNAIGYKAWDIYFKAYQCDVLQIDFEDLVSDRDRTLEILCEFLDVPCELEKLQEKLISTHTAINDKWHRKTLEAYARYL